MKKTILIDVDDVICENHFFNIVNEYLTLKGMVPLKSLDNFSRPDFENEVFPTDEERHSFSDYYITRDSYEGVNPIDGAVEGIRQLLKKNDVYMVTSCIHYERERDFARQFTDKFKWILDTFPFFPPENIIMVNKKHVFRGDVIIDDRLKNLQGEYPIKILFSSFHNDTVSDQELKEVGAVRAKDWNEIVSIINNS